MNKEIIGKRLRRQREKLSMTREKFAEQIDISPQFLAELENGKKGMSAETLCSICEKTKTSADYLLLGRQLTDVKTPAIELILEIPSCYSDAIEDILRAYIDTITIASSKDDG